MSNSQIFLSLALYIYCLSRAIASEPLVNSHSSELPNLEGISLELVLGSMNGDGSAETVVADRQLDRLVKELGKETPYSLLLATVDQKLTDLPIQKVIYRQGPYANRAENALSLDLNYGVLNNFMFQQARGLDNSTRQSEQLRYLDGLKTYQHQESYLEKYLRITRLGITRTLSSSAYALQDGLGFGAGNDSTCLISASKDVYCLGIFPGDIKTQDKELLAIDKVTPVKGLSNAEEVSVGVDHGCAITLSGKLYCFGANWAGQLGSDGNGMIEAQPVLGLDHVISVSADLEHTCAVANGGKLYCWGKLTRGLIERGIDDPSWLPYEIEGLENIIQVAAGNEHTCAVDESGVVYCFGRNNKGQLGREEWLEGHAYPVDGLPPVVQVAAGYDFTCALTRSGDVYCFGHNDDRGYFDPEGDGGATPVLVEGLVNIKTIAVGFDSTYAINRAGDLFSFGSNNKKKLGRPGGHSNEPAKVLNLPPMQKVTAGTYHACAMSEVGQLYCFGDNSFNQLGLHIKEVAEPELVLEYPYFNSQFIASQVNYGSSSALKVSQENTADEDHRINAEFTDNRPIYLRRQGGGSAEKIASNRYPKIAQAGFDKLAYLAFSRGAQQTAIKLLSRGEDQTYLIYPQGENYQYAAISAAYPDLEGSGAVHIIFSFDKPERELSIETLRSKGIGIVFPVAPGSSRAFLDDRRLLGFDALDENLWELSKPWHKYLQAPMLTNGPSPDGKLRHCQDKQTYPVGWVLHGDTKMQISLRDLPQQMVTLAVGIADQGPICRYGHMTFKVEGIKGQSRTALATIDVQGDELPKELSLNLAGFDSLEVTSQAVKGTAEQSSSLAAKLRHRLGQSLYMTTGT